MTTVHTITATQKTMDSPLGVCGARTMGLPRMSPLTGTPRLELNGKLTGMAFHVPTSSWSWI